MPPAPADQGAAPARTGTHVTEDSDEGLVRVLLVDDQELVRSGLRRILRRRDGVVVVGECEDGDQVTAAVRELRPDVVVMDLRMRRVNGIDATRALRSRPGAPPVLVLTTFNDDELLGASLAAGPQGGEWVVQVELPRGDTARDATGHDCPLPRLVRSLHRPSLGTT